MGTEQIFGCKHCEQDDWSPKLTDVRTIGGIICEFYRCSLCKRITLVYQSSGQICLGVFRNADETYSLLEPLTEHSLTHE